MSVFETSALQSFVHRTFFVALPVLLLDAADLRVRVGVGVSATGLDGALATFSWSRRDVRRVDTIALAPALALVCVCVLRSWLLATGTSQTVWLKLQK